jgi:hypothetical protein
VGFGSAIKKEEATLPLKLHSEESARKDGLAQVLVGEAEGGGPLHKGFGKGDRFSLREAEGPLGKSQGELGKKAVKGFRWKVGLLPKVADEALRFEGSAPAPPKEGKMGKAQPYAGTRKRGQRRQNLSRLKPFQTKSYLYRGP